MAGDRPIFTNIPILQQAGTKIGAALGDYQRRKQEEQYWNDILSGVSTPEQMNTPIGREVWKKYLRNQLYAPLSQEGGYEIPLQDLDQRILQSQSFQTPEGYKDAEFFDKQRKHLYEQKKDYDEAIRNYEKDTLEKYFTKAKRSPLYQDLVRILLQYQKNKDKHAYTHGVRNLLRQLGFFENTPITRSDIERVLEGKALELLDIKEKGGSNPSTVEFKAMVRSFVNVLNDLEGNLQLLIPQALQARTANAYYDAFKKIKPSDFRSVEKYKEALGKEAKKVLRKDKDLDFLDEIGQSLGIDTSDIVKTAALTPLFEEIEEKINLPKNQPKPLESFSRGGYEERDIQPRDISSSEPFIGKENDDYQQIPFSFLPESLRQLQTESPVEKTPKPESMSPWEQIKERLKQDGTHIGVKGIRGKLWKMSLPWDLLSWMNNKRYDQYAKEGLSGEEILNRELDRNHDYLPEKYREMINKKYREIADKNENDTYHFPSFQEFLENMATKGWDYDPNKVSKTAQRLGNALEWYNAIRTGPKIKDTVPTSIAKAVGGTVLQEGLEKVPFLPKWLAPLLAVGVAEGVPAYIKSGPSNVGKIRKIDKFTPENITNKTWKGDELAYAQSEVPITREAHESLSKVLTKRAEKVGAKMERRSLLQMEAAVDKAYDKVNDILDKSIHSQKDIQPIVLKELNKEIAVVENNLIKGTSTAEKEKVLDTLKKYKKNLVDSKRVKLQGAVGEMRSWRQKKSAGYDPAVPMAQQKADYELANIMTNVFENSVGKAVPEVAPVLKKATHLYKLHKNDLFLDELAKKFTGSHNTEIPSKAAHLILSDIETTRDLKRILTPKEYNHLKQDITKYSERIDKLKLADRFRLRRTGNQGWLKNTFDTLGKSPEYVKHEFLNRKIKSLGQPVRRPLTEGELKSLSKGVKQAVSQGAGPLIVKTTERKKEKKRPPRQFKWKKREERLIDRLK